MKTALFYFILNKSNLFLLVQGYWDVPHNNSETILTIC
ncbi:hypothetical protein FTV88_3194 [Heliorestis convoluta]|uniref:Uncharacterized protein n=1 Tax=Heliorestis convoluta TaxID=356322 RepID=A0A5Q2NAG7_9FIRM|nr:hypothetical protein FTV88_3194 [Heliorestis convoluta]